MKLDDVLHYERQFGPDWGMRISRERDLYAEPMLDADNIRREFGCSRSKAYEYLHAALSYFNIRLEPGMQLRIRWSTWQRYKESRIPWARTHTVSPSAEGSGTPTSTRTASVASSRRSARTLRLPSSSCDSSSAMERIQPTQPRRKLR